MLLFSTEFILFSIMGYQVSLIEFLAMLFGYVSVFLAIRENIYTWPTGIFNEIALLILFFQIQLYADMLLQCVFMVFTIYGWLHWDRRNQTLAISQLGGIKLLQLLLALLLLSALLSLLINRLHLWFPSYFEHPAAHPFIDSLVCLLSIAAILLLAFKVLESWVLWIIVDVLSIGLFATQGIYLITIQYCIFLLMAIAGFYRWRKRLVQ